MKTPWRHQCTWVCESHLMAGIVAAKGCGGRAYKNTLQASLIMEHAKHIESCLQPQLIMEHAKHIASAMKDCIACYEVTNEVGTTIGKCF